MFKKILIANRGAIAVRIIRTLKKMKIQSVAVYADSDMDSLHVHHADEAYCLGGGAATQTYLDIDKIIDIAKKTGAEAIHPGYGFLSENAQFIHRLDAEGLVFIGPTAQQVEVFGLKHKARELAEQADVPLTPGTSLLKDVDGAIQEAETMGYPVMLKSTAGGGGIGMQLCHSSEELLASFATVKRLGESNFSDDGVFLEKFVDQARHIEVQVFGDGQGHAIAIGERDCSSQRRNQKVVEECPAPNLPEFTRNKLFQAAESLLANVNYRNAGTVEFIYDVKQDEFYFLEVNTRLQVEHGVTEEVYGIDLVEWMVSLAAGEQLELLTTSQALKAKGHAVQVRLYAEDPYLDFQPCAGLLSKAEFPEFTGLRIDTWIESGIDIPLYFDPMLAKVIVHAKDRQSALQQLYQALEQTKLYGIETNLQYLCALLQDQHLIEGKVTTRYLNDFKLAPKRIDVLHGGTLTTIQDFPARLGYWDVGVPPSGPFDSLSFRLLNRLLGNDGTAAGIEITAQGPSLKFASDTVIAIGGAEIDAALITDTDSNQEPKIEQLQLWKTIKVFRGQTLRFGKVAKQGARSYLCVLGGIDCPDYLGSKSTFTLGQFGGHNGRALRTADVLNLTRGSQPDTDFLIQKLADELKPKIINHWQINVIYGPHGAPDFFTAEDVKTFFEHQWEVHYNSSRTGVRLIGPKPEWARKDGGEAGLHPSNIHDNAYAFGSIDFTGDMPVILGPDGPSLGGFVCLATVIEADLWKLGQLTVGDKISFKPINIEHAVALEKSQLVLIDNLELIEEGVSGDSSIDITSPIINQLSADEVGVEVNYRVGGDHFLLIEYGQQVLDIALRFRVHALMQWLHENPITGVSELTPGIRSLQVHYDGLQISFKQLVEHLHTAEYALKEQVNQLSVSSRIVYLPLSWNDEACQLAVEKYQQIVRKDAPWYPDNLEFIRRINGLNNIEEVKKIVFDASYLVMGLGDVYLGAPVATPVDPRHRLVTTKYNPARTWTAENSVGIGGAYMCIYGMEGPGGYQFIGRTLQMWNRYQKTNDNEKPWLLRFFDQIRFYEVSHEELQTIRREYPKGRYPIKIEETEFSLNDYEQFLSTEQLEIQAFQQQREAAFAAELAEWHAKGKFNFVEEEPVSNNALDDQQWPEGSVIIESPVSGGVLSVKVEVDQIVEDGDCLVVMESMKMEISVQASSAGRINQVLFSKGQRVNVGQPVVVITPI